MKQVKFIDQNLICNLKYNKIYDVTWEDSKDYLIHDNGINKGLWNKRHFEEIEKFQSINVKNIEEVFIYNNWQKVLADDKFKKYRFNNYEFEFYLYNDDFLFYYKKNNNVKFIKHNNLDKVLEFMKEFVELKPLPKKTFKEWFLINRFTEFLSPYSLKDLDDEFYFIGSANCSEHLFAINKNWSFDKQKDVFNKLIEIYK